MKKLLLTFTLLLTGGLAESADTTTETRFSYHNPHALYACSYAERQAKDYIRSMGGELVSIRCSGGLPDWNSLTLDVAFRAPYAADKGEWSPVSLRGNQACDFNKRLIEHLLPFFEVRNLKARTSCWNASGRFSYVFDVLVSE